MASIENERLIFRAIFQPYGESIENFVKRLRAQISKCGFQEKEIENNLKDQISVKCSNLKLRQIALHADMTFEELVETGKVLEGEASNKVVCTRCGFPRHIESDPSCPAKKSPPCESCNRKGHFKRMCKRRLRLNSKSFERRDLKIPRTYPIKTNIPEIPSLLQISVSESLPINVRNFSPSTPESSRPETPRPETPQESQLFNVVTEIKHETNGNEDTENLAKLEAQEK